LTSTTSSSSKNKPYCSRQKIERVVTRGLQRDRFEKKPIITDFNGPHRAPNAFVCWAKGKVNELREEFSEDGDRKSKVNGKWLCNWRREPKESRIEWHKVAVKAFADYGRRFEGLERN